MAKQGKSGLGRGLNSLLSGSMVEAVPEEKPVKERVVVSEKAEDKKKETDTPKKPDSKGETQKKDTSVNKGPKKAETPIEQKKTAAKEELRPSIKEDDNVTIKSVVERKPDEVPLLSIKPNPDQPRTNFKQEEIEELAASIEKEGLLQPILVRSIGDKYQIIAGERRWQACRSLGYKTVPVRIREANDDEALELALVENIQRSDLNPIEEAYGYRRLMERQGLTQSEVAEAVSKGRSTVANALRLLELPEQAQQLLFEEKISAGHARAILSIPTKEGRQKLTDKMVQEKISVREAEMIARLLSGSNKKEDGSSARTPTPKSFKRVARALRESLNTNVKVKTVQGKNKIEIEFETEEDLERLFENITAFQND